MVVHYQKTADMTQYHRIAFLNVNYISTILQQEYILFFISPIKKTNKKLSNLKKLQLLSAIIGHARSTPRNYFVCAT
jgi:hypothetical protein